MMKPSLTLMVKLGSLAVHIEEFFEDMTTHRHEAVISDREAMHIILKDPEVLQWLSEMDGQALLPKKRNSHAAPTVTK